MSWRWLQVWTCAESKQLSQTAVECIDMWMELLVVSLDEDEGRRWDVAVRRRCCGCRAGQQATSRAPGEANLKMFLLPGTAVVISKYNTTYLWDLTW